MAASVSATNSAAIGRDAIETISQTSAPAPWDTELEEHAKHGAEQNRKRAWDETKAAKIGEWKQQYDAYLLTDAWGQC